MDESGILGSVRISPAIEPVAGPQPVVGPQTESVTRPAPAPAATPAESPETQLAAAIRRIIREELGTKPDAPAAAPTPTAIIWRETATILVLITLAVLIYTWIPSEYLNKEQVDFVTKLIPFLGGGLVLTRPAWLTGKIVAFGRMRRVLEVELAVLAIILFARFGVVPIRPAGEPTWANLYIGGQLAKSGEKTWVRIQDQEIEIRGIKPSERQRDRKVTLGWPAVMRAAVGGGPALRWPLLYRVYLNFDDSGQYLVRIEKTNSEFDNAVRAQIQTESDLVDSRTFRHRFRAATDSYPIWLPYGEYKMSATLMSNKTTTCFSPMEASVIVDENSEDVSFRKLKCP